MRRVRRYRLLLVGAGALGVVAALAIGTGGGRGDVARPAAAPSAAVLPASGAPASGAPVGLREGARAPSPAPVMDAASTPGGKDRHAQAEHEALARPLFNRSRRPARDVASGPARAPRLVGAVVSASGSFALFAVAGQARGVAVLRGQRIGPYRVVAIAANTVRVATAGGARVLHVQTRHTRPASGPASGASPGPSPGPSSGSSFGPHQGEPDADAGPVQPDRDPAHPVVILPLPVTSSSP